MFETNTASCGGFPGVSDTYGVALWAIDYGMQLAYGNFSHGLFHTGGQNSFYNVGVFFWKITALLNLFTYFVCSLLPVNIPIFSIFSPHSHAFSFPAPPSNQSAIHQWTVGAIYYSAIVLAEAFGTTNTSQIIDLGANAENVLTPAYAIYEQGSLSKVALINFMDDNQTATHGLEVTLEVPSGIPQSVQVKYVLLLKKEAFCGLLG